LTGLANRRYFLETAALEVEPVNGVRPVGSRGHNPKMSLAPSFTRLPRLTEHAAQLHQSRDVSARVWIDKARNMLESETPINPVGLL
jgi:hypothetical protein